MQVIPYGPARAPCSWPRATSACANLAAVRDFTQQGPAALAGMWTPPSSCVHPRACCANDPPGGATIQAVARTRSALRSRRARGRFAAEDHGVVTDSWPRSIGPSRETSIPHRRRLSQGAGCPDRVRRLGNQAGERSTPTRHWSASAPTGPEVLQEEAVRLWSEARCSNGRSSRPDCDVSASIARFSRGPESIVTGGVVLLGGASFRFDVGREHARPRTWARRAQIRYEEPDGRRAPASEAVRASLVKRSNAASRCRCSRRRSIQPSRPLCRRPGRAVGPFRTAPHVDHLTRRPGHGPVATLAATFRPPRPTSASLKDRHGPPTHLASMRRPHGGLRAAR